ncbi:MAG: decarboxylating 6-phosphogluconate dehydrogenase [Acidobacteriota bacterium]|nr:decarboxylating 6-phosphogluconate dehydrogenase [Acidobacteriota bacterium]
MQIGMIGLGRMGGNMARRLMESGHDLVIFNRTAEKMKSFVAGGATGTSDLRELVDKLEKPRVVWIMLPAGEVTENTLMEIAENLEPDDIIIDGGNSNFKDDIRRANLLKEEGIRFLDAGTSGGVWGAERGYCLMVGGDESAFKQAEPIFKSLAPGNAGIEETKGRENLQSTAAEGYLYCGKAGAGHFVKMVHNGIEYGLMQAFAEGFDIFKNANKDTLPEERRYDLNLPDIAELWRRGSVVSSWLLDLTALALAENHDLSEYSGFVEDSGEGRWTIEAALEEAVPAEVLTSALYTRFRSRQEHTFAEKVLSAMREKFGGHLEPRSEKVGEKKLMSGKTDTETKD